MTSTTDEVHTMIHTASLFPTKKTVDSPSTLPRGPKVHKSEAYVRMYAPTHIHATHKVYCKVHQGDILTGLGEMCL